MSGSSLWLAAIWSLILIVSHSGGPPAAFAAGEPNAPRIEDVRSLYLKAVADERAIAMGLQAIAEVRAAGVAPGSSLAPILDAYEGALITLRAKHSFWPQAKLRHLGDGLAMLDSVVAAHPSHTEARYLRLMSCYYLPRILGRGWSVREDFAALAHLLPKVRDEYPVPLYAGVVRFVLEHGDPDAERRVQLLAVLEEVDE